MRGYQINQIRESFDKAKAFTQMDLLTKPQEKQNNTKFLPFVIPLDKTTVQIASIIYKHWSTIESEPKISRVRKKTSFLLLQGHKKIFK